MKIPAFPLFGLASVVFFAAATATCQAEMKITAVALSGQAAPGLDAGITFQGEFRDVQINNLGQVLFIADIAGHGVTSSNRTGLWVGTPGDLQLAFRTGDSAPGYTNGVTFFYFAKPLLIDNAGAAAYARLSGPGISSDASEPGNDDTLWASLLPPSNLAKTVAADRTERRPNRLLTRFASASYQDIQDVCFSTKIIRWWNMAGDAHTEYATGLLLWAYGVLKRSKAIHDGRPIQSANLPAAEITSHPGFFQLRPDGSLTNLLLTGDPAPGRGEPFESVAPDSFAGSPSNVVTFIANVASGDGIWYGSPPDLKPIAMVGTAAPLLRGAEANSATNQLWRGLSGPVGINAKGEIAFIASLDTGLQIVAGSPGSLRLAARSVPEDGAQGGFTSFASLVLNRAGEIAFFGGHTSLREIPGVNGLPGVALNGFGISDHGGPPKLMLTEGNGSPGLGPSELISFFGYGGGPFMNARGQAVLHAEIGTAVGFEHRTDQAVWLVDPGRGAQIIARGGTSIPIEEGQTRMIDRMSVSFASTHDSFRAGGEDGRSSPFNDLGQVVFIARWTESNGQNRAGVFVASDAPELAGRRNGDDIELEFTTVAARRYQVEFRDAVEAGPWTVLSEIEGTGSSVLIKDPGAAGRPKRFYRVALIP